MNILGIETSCDETAAAVVRDGRDVLSNTILSQIKLHAPYGGVVPEIASRNHVEALPHVLETAIGDSGLDWDAIDAVAVTYGPGLSSSLMVGMAAAKALSQSLDRPLVAINHLEAHLYSIFLDPDLPDPETLGPLLVLLVSGGHSCLVDVEALGRYRLLGQTMDDAAGEAFDKGATLLGLGYPGGPQIEKAAREGDPTAIDFPRSRQRKSTARVGDLDVDCCFSFSGLKTALLYYLKKHPDFDLADVAAGYQEAIVDTLVARTRDGLAKSGRKVLAAVGGVALNGRLRLKLEQLAQEEGVRLIPAGRAYCTDNAAMIAGLAGAGRGLRGSDAMSADANPNLCVATS